MQEIVKFQKQTIYMHRSNLHTGCEGEPDPGSISNAVHTLYFIMFKWRDTNFVCAVAHTESEKYNVCAHTLKCFWIFLNIKSLDHSVT